MRDSLLMAVRAVTAMAGDSAELYDAWIGELYELVRAHVLNLRDAARGGGAGVLPPWEASSVEGRCLVGQKMFGAVDTAAHLVSLAPPSSGVTRHATAEERQATRFFHTIYSNLGVFS